MAFPVPATVVSANSGGSVTSQAGTFTSAIAAATPLVIGISVASDTPTISSVGPDTKGNIYTLVGHQVTTTGRPIWIYSGNIVTPLTTSDTLTVTISSGAVINLIGVAGPGTLFIPRQFTGGSDTVAAASFALAVPALPTPAAGFMLAFSVNGSAAPTWLTPGPTVLTTISGGGGPFFSCAYEDVTDFPASLEVDLSPVATASMAVTAFMRDYTDLYATSYAELYGQFTGTPWPQSGALQLAVQLLLNGTWTDITGYVMQRDGSLGIEMSWGRPDESSKIVTAQCAVQLNNRAGTFSPRNAASPFFPFIGANTQLRVLVPLSYNGDDAGLQTVLTGEVSSWPPSWDVTGSDVWVSVTASGITRRLNQQPTLGSTIKRFYLGKDPADPTYPVAYWPMEDGASSTTLAEVTGLSPAMVILSGTPTLSSDASFAGSDPIPVLNSAWLSGSLGAFGDTGSALFTIPGTHPFVPRAGLSTLTAAEYWGGSGGGTNGYQANNGKDAAGGGGEYAKETAVAVTAGTSYPVIVGAGGAGGPLASGAGLKPNPGADGGTSSTVWNSVTVTAHGGKGGTFTGARAGAGGTGSTNATHHDGGAGGKNSGAFFGGSGGGSSGGSSAAGNAGGNGGASNTGAAGGVAVAGGGQGGKGGNGGASVDQGGSGGGTGGGGGSGGENSSNSAAHSGGNGGPGQVKLSWTPLVSPAYNVVRFLLHVPAGGDTNNEPVVRVFTSGVVAQIDLTYTTASSGSLTMTGFAAGGATLFTSVAQTFINGGLFLVSMELVPGATVGYNLGIMQLVGTPPLIVFGNSAGTASASGAVGVVTSVEVNSHALLAGSSVGHVLVQYSFETLQTLSGGTLSGHGTGPATGWDGELGGHRFNRLCTEEGITSVITGYTGSNTPAMGPQPDDKLINVLQQVEDADGGLLTEPPGFLGLGYRCRDNMTSQFPGLLADYSAAHLSPPFQPVDDVQLIRNIVTVNRVNGSSVTVRQATGPKSYLDPPNGVGTYAFTLDVNVHADSQLAAIAARILAAGTVDDYRYPQVSFQLSRTAAQALFSSLVRLGAGDRVKILSPPSFLTASTIDQLAYGFAVSISGFRYDVTLNCVPASPFGP
jgi:hypothetical protein